MSENQAAEKAALYERLKEKLLQDFEPAHQELPEGQIAISAAALISGTFGTHAAKRSGVELIIRGREACLAKAAITASDIDDKEDCAKYAVFELPTGVPSYPPSQFIASGRSWSQPWADKKINSPKFRSEMQEATTMMNVGCWMGHCLVGQELILSLAAKMKIDDPTFMDLVKATAEYGKISYEALQERRDYFEYQHADPRAAAQLDRHMQNECHTTRMAPSARMHKQQLVTKTAEQEAKAIATANAGLALHGGASLKHPNYRAMGGRSPLTQAEMESLAKEPRPPVPKMFGTGEADSTHERVESGNGAHSQESDMGGDEGSSVSMEIRAGLRPAGIRGAKIWDPRHAPGRSGSFQGAAQVSKVDTAGDQLCTRNHSQEAGFESMERANEDRSRGSTIRFRRIHLDGQQGENEIGSWTTPIISTLDRASEENEHYRSFRWGAATREPDDSLRLRRWVPSFSIASRHEDILRSTVRGAIFRVWPSPSGGGIRGGGSSG